MAQVEFSEPITDSADKVDDAISVGEDLDFQRRWWRFEHAIWIFFLLVLVADVLGVFGRGWLSKAERHTKDQTLHVKYERVERASTPSIMTISFGPAAIREGHIQLFVSESLIKELGNRRIAPQPASSVLGESGVTYTFPATAPPATIEFMMQPSFPGIHDFELQIPGSAAVHARIFVVP